MKYYKKYMILLIYSLLAINFEKVNALTTTPGTSFLGGPSNSYSVSTDSSGLTNEYKTKIFLLTLVNNQGERVNGTNSVYYKDDTNKDFKMISSGMKCKYKYSNIDETCKEYQTDLTGDNTTYDNSMDTIGRIFQENIITRKKIYELSGSEKYDFITSFLYQINFLDSNEGYYDIDDNHLNSKRKEISDNNYFILIEPTYEYALQGNTYFGTSRELAQELKKLGWIPYNLMSDFTYNIGINLYITQEQANTLQFDKITKGYMNIIKSGAANQTVISEWEAIASPEYGNGMGIIKISDYTIPVSESEIKITKENCATEGENRANGIIEFDLEMNFDEFDDAIQSGVEFEQDKISVGNIYCYDNIKYDFSNIINNINSIGPSNYKAKIHSYVDIGTGTATITRYCYVKLPTRLYDTEKNNFANNFSDYENLKIPLNAFGTTINLEKIKTDDIAPDETKIITINNQKIGIYKKTKTITFGYNKLYIGNNQTITNPESIDSYIDFNNISYGYSTKLYKEATDGKTYPGNTTFYIKVESSKGEKKCEFKTKITGDAMEEIKFRTISLDNPFPSRDASTRLPGYNWLGKDNYVRTYINHNRGVKGSEVYNKEPLYTVTLSPTEIVKIREYNKNKSYSDIELECVGENNTSCLSIFLRNELKGNISGQCMIEKNNIESDPLNYKSTNRDILIKKLEQVRNSKNILTYSYSKEELELDFNNDGLLTLRDEYIYDNAEKTTTYYTCAEKTYENSGYMKGETK